MPPKGSLPPYWRAKLDISPVYATAPDALKHGRCHYLLDKYLIFYLMLLEPLTLKLVPFDLKCGFADFPLIGMRAAPDNEVILRSLEQNLAPDRCKKYEYFKRSLRGGLFCVPHNY
jgi:hypothetical protein